MLCISKLDIICLTFTTGTPHFGMIPQDMSQWTECASMRIMPEEYAKYANMPVAMCRPACNSCVSCLIWLCQHAN